LNEPHHDGIVSARMCNLPPTGGVLRRMMQGSKSTRVRSVIERMESARSITEIFSPAVNVRHDSVPSGVTDDYELDVHTSLPIIAHSGSTLDASGPLMRANAHGFGVANLSVGAMITMWKLSASARGFLVWSMWTKYHKAWNRNGEDMNELMELQRVVLSDLEKQLNNLTMDLVDFTEGKVELETLTMNVNDQHWTLLVEEMNALLEVLQARVQALQDKHAEHAAWNRRLHLLNEGWHSWRMCVDHRKRDKSNDERNSSGENSANWQHTAIAALEESVKTVCQQRDINRLLHCCQIVSDRGLMYGFTRWMLATKLARSNQRLQMDGQAVALQQLSVVWEHVHRERMSQRGFARWVEYTVHSGGERMVRLEQERMVRQRAEHFEVVGDLRQQIAELCTECNLRAAAAQDAAPPRISQHSEASNFQVKVHRLGAKAILRIVAASRIRCLNHGLTTWRLDTTACRATAAAKSAVAVVNKQSTHDCINHQNVLARAAERIANAHDSENRSPSHSSSLSSEPSKPLQKAIHLRQRLQEHAPISTPGVQLKVTPHREKGALLRGLRLRLEQ